jgi:hypothetical protein
MYPSTLSNVPCFVLIALLETQPACPRKFHFTSQCQALGPCTDCTSGELPSFRPRQPHTLEFTPRAPIDHEHTSDVPAKKRNVFLVRLPLRNGCRCSCSSAQQEHRKASPRITVALFSSSSPRVIVGGIHQRANLTYRNSNTPHICNGVQRKHKEKQWETSFQAPEPQQLSTRPERTVCWHYPNISQLRR